jgi:CRISPR-associated protein Csb2
VTPVILPGHDDPDSLRRKYRARLTAGKASAADQRHLLERLNDRIENLLWKAFEQAGWPPETLAGATLEHRGVGWLPRLGLAREYELPKVHYPRYHVRITFPRPVRGPVVVGAGRYRGLGLFVGMQ